MTGRKHYRYFRGEKAYCHCKIGENHILPEKEKYKICVVCKGNGVVLEPNKGKD